MIQINYPYRNTQIEAWEEQLKSWVIAFKMVENQQLKEAVLIDGQREIKGESDIQTYLKQLKADLDDWRTPRCGV